MKNKLYLLCILLLITACSSKIGQVDFGDAGSPCDYSSEQIGEYVKIGGLLEFVDITAPDGWYADLERDNCRIGIWVEAKMLEEWQPSDPDSFKEGTVVIFEGYLTSQPLPDRPDEFQLIVEVDQPPSSLLMITEEKQHSDHGLSSCSFPETKTGEKVSATGEVLMVDDSAAAGVYLEVNEGGCFKRVWVERRFFEEWTEAQQQITAGNDIEAEGILTTVRGEQTVDISEPPIQK